MIVSENRLNNKEFRSDPHGVPSGPWWWPGGGGGGVDRHRISIVLWQAEADERGEGGLSLRGCRGRGGAGEGISVADKCSLGQPELGPNGTRRK